MSPVDYHAWTHRPKALGGTDPIDTNLPKWAAVWDNAINGQTLANTAGTINVYHEEGVVSDSGGDIFNIDLRADPGVGFDIAVLQLLESGIYSFTFNGEISDQTQDHYLMSMLLTGFNFPGQGINSMKNTWIRDLTNYSDKDHFIHWSMTLPCRVTTPPNDLTLQWFIESLFSSQAVSIFLGIHQLTAVYHGPVDAASFAAWG